MATINKQSTKNKKVLPKRKRPPGKTPEAEENRLIGLAISMAAEQLESGKASSQVLTHFLKLASVKEKLEREILLEEVKLKRAKTEAIASGKRIEELYTNAVEAMRSYAGVEYNDD